MKILCLVTLVALAAAAPRLHPSTQHLITEADTYVVGRSDASPGQFPFQGSLLSSTSPSGSHLCGATYIGGRWAMCAAHCTISTARSVWFGLHKHSDTSEGEHRTFTRMVNHPDYGSGPGAYPNDISLLEMTSPVSGPNISAAILPSNGDFAGQNATLSGWGRTCGSYLLSDVLQFVNIGVLSNSQCEEYWGSNINPGHICGIDGSCFFDSGGPMSIGKQVIGITSWGGSLPSYPSVYTRVTIFRDWIREVSGI